MYGRTATFSRRYGRPRAAKRSLSHATTSFDVGMSISSLESVVFHFRGQSAGGDAEELGRCVAIGSLGESIHDLGLLDQTRGPRCSFVQCAAQIERLPQ